MEAGVRAEESRGVSAGEKRTRLQYETRMSKVFENHHGMRKQLVLVSRAALTLDSNGPDSGVHFRGLGQLPLPTFIIYSGRI